jgi:hypothetical protein
MIARSIALVLWLSAVSAWGRSDTFRVPVDDVRILMVAAIDSPTGAALGLLSGKQADAITQHFKATSPILIDVSTERRYQQPGCSRLKVSFTQEGLTLPGFTAPQRRTVDVGLNYCRDGKPPKSPV